MFGISSETVTCPHCHAVITTNLEKEIPSSVHVAACLLCVVFFPLAWLPYYMNERKINHYCSECNALLGAHVPPDTMCYSYNDPSCCLPMFNCGTCDDCCNCEPKSGREEVLRVEGSNEESCGCFPCVDCGNCGDCGDCDCGDCGGCDCGDCGGCDCNF